MSELDTWVTEYEGRVCDDPAYHIYRVARKDGWDVEQHHVGSTVAVDGADYYICCMEEVGTDDADYWLVYAHYVPQAMSEKDWNGLYGDTELVDAG